MNDAATPTTATTPAAQEPEARTKPRGTSAFSFAAGALLAIGVFGTALPRVLNKVNVISADARDQLIGLGWVALAGGVLFLALAVWRLSSKHEHTDRTSNQIVVDLRSATVITKVAAADAAAAATSPIRAASAGRS